MYVLYCTVGISSWRLYVYDSNSYVIELCSNLSFLLYLLHPLPRRLEIITVLHTPSCKRISLIPLSLFFSPITGTTATPTTAAPTATSDPDQGTVWRGLEGGGGEELYECLRLKRFLYNSVGLYFYVMSFSCLVKFAHVKLTERDAFFFVLSWRRKE